MVSTANVGVLFMTILGTEACTGTAVNSSATAMTSCHRWEGPEEVQVAARHRVECFENVLQALGETESTLAQGLNAALKEARRAAQDRRQNVKLSFNVLRIVFDKWRRNGWWSKKLWTELSRVCP